MTSLEIMKLPFYWRLRHKNSKTINVVNDYYPFTFDVDTEHGLIIERRDQSVLAALNLIYQQDYNIGYLQDANEIAKPYGEDFIAYLRGRLEENPSITKILEIGCGGCTVLADLKSSGYKVCGIDSSPFASVEGTKKGIDVVNDFFPSKQLTGKFDLIFHVDVLEHIDAYIDFLQYQFEHLNDGGLLVVNVPNATESIQLGDISMAMHQHLNYFTEISLTTALEVAGFEVTSVVKAGYGGSLYATGRKSSRKTTKNVSFDAGAYETFFTQASKIINAFDQRVEQALSQPSRTLGFYVPLRTLPYIAKKEIYSGFRFFDDTSHWHQHVFDGIDVPIENFQDLVQRPVTDLVIMSLTFGDVIRNKVRKEFGDKVNVTTLGELAAKASTK
jgi:2-polyprenyl-3-methyl-5-hydroxy-6-metoxy-1,4-benzoquinol methylase